MFSRALFFIIQVVGMIVAAWLTLTMPIYHPYVLITVWTPTAVGLIVWLVRSERRSRAAHEAAAPAARALVDEWSAIDEQLAMHARMTQLQGLQEADRILGYDPRSL